jgi:hypothetical protein
MNTSWYNTRAGREWRILMQDMTNVFPGNNNKYIESFATLIGAFCGISPNVILGWIVDGKIPSIDNLQKTLDIFVERMKYRPRTMELIIESTRHFKKEIREQPYLEDKIERLNKYLRKNTLLLDRLVEKYCDPPILITARITAFNSNTNKYHVHFYNFKKSNTAFMRERINTYNQIKNLIESTSVRDQVAGHIKNKNFVINLDLENSIKEK